MNWDQLFSVSALCEDCDVSPEIIQYTWRLYLVNASSRPVIEGKINSCLFSLGLGSAYFSFNGVIVITQVILDYKKTDKVSFTKYLITLCSIPVPFCYTVDLSAPSTVIKGPATTSQTPSAVDTVNYTPDSAPVLLTEITSKTTTKKQNVDLTDSGTTSNKNRNASNKAGVLLNAL